jgi:DNA-binding transcriptional ArsR family regulator
MTERAATPGTVESSCGRWPEGYVRLVPAHLQQLTAELFKTMGHPARVRVLELLGQHDHVVADLIREVGLEPSHLSQQLAILRRGSLVTSRREGSAVVYSLTDPRIADLLATARTILLEAASENQNRLSAG